jgi:hypothetical protein
MVSPERGFLLYPYNFLIWTEEIRLRFELEKVVNFRLRLGWLFPIQLIDILRRATQTTDPKNQSVIATAVSQFSSVYFEEKPVVNA